VQNPRPALKRQYVTINVSCEADIKAAALKVVRNRREFRTLSAYGCHLFIKDLRRRGLIK
jgi:hypothetical protein